ncbi:MAG: hypothetical protein JXL80_12765 [Planctomycetes bacterium]|nr:hypothetical protein [Planctomycetota bacterium]
MAESDERPYRCVWFYTTYAMAAAAVGALLPFESVVTRLLVAALIALVPFSLLAVAWRPQMLVGLPRPVAAKMTTARFWAAATVLTVLLATIAWTAVGTR